MTKSCQTCLHHDVCDVALLMFQVAEKLCTLEQYNQFSKDIREFLGSKCPHYGVEEIEDEINLA